MKVVLKKLVDTKWQMVDINDLVGTSICQHIMRAKDTHIAALYEGEEPVAFLSNDPEYVEKYKERGLSLSCVDLMLLVGSNVMPSLIAKELGGTLQSIELTEEKTDELP